MRGRVARRHALGGTLLVLLLTAPRAQAQRPKVQSFSVDDGLPSAYIFDLAEDRESGRIAILTRFGVTVYDRHTFKTYTHADGLPSTELGALAVDPAGRIWTMVRRDWPIVCRLEDTWWCSGRLPSGASSSTAEARPPLEMGSLALADRDGGGVLAAVGSLAAGLWLWEEDAGARAQGTWRRVQSADGLPADEVVAVETVAGDFAVGTAAGLCFLRDGTLDLHLRERIPRLGDPVLALYSAGDALWILSPGWLGRLEAGNLEVLKPDLDLLPASRRTPGVVLADTFGRVFFGARVAFVLDTQDGRVTPLGRARGLVAEGVTALLLDRELNLWVGSSRGLDRIGSWRFLSWDTSHGLLEDEVSAILEPRPGRYVLGHNNGLTLLDLERSSTVHLPFAPSVAPESNRIMDMALDADGRVWLAAHRKGLLELEPPFPPGRAERLPTWRVWLPGSAVISVEIDAAGRLWALSFKHLFVREGDRMVVVEHGQEGLGALRWLEVGREGALYISTENGLLWFDGTSWRQARASEPDANILYGLYAAPSGTVWVGTLAGLYQLREDRLEKVRQGALRVDRPVYFILTDGGGRLWIGTDDGVFVWDGDHLRHLSVPHGLVGRETNRGAGLLDHLGRVWIGTDRGVSMYQERFDLRHRTPPLVELGPLEVNGQKGPPASGEIHLAPQQKNLTFPFRTVSFATEAEVQVRYRLDPFDSDWSTQVASRGEIRYTNVPPGRYRLHLQAGWEGDEGGAWGAEARSPDIVIARPLWHQGWFLGLVTSLVIAGTAGAHRLRTRALRRRAREREALITELEAKNAELERFTYTVSHDLKSPLFTIKGFLGLLRRDVTSGHAERLEHDLRQIEHAADNMGNLLRELLELSRIGRVVHPEETVVLGDVAGEALELLAGQIAEHGVRFEMAADLPVVVGDRDRLREVFQNLIENAIRFRSEERPPRIDVGVESQDGEDVLFVRDNGVGVDPSYHEKIFGLFERLDAKIEGTGIGLTLVKRIVELHGGRIWVESEGRGRGSRFCFTLAAPPPR